MYLYVIVGAVLAGLLAWAEARREAANARRAAWERWTRERYQ